MICPNCKTIDMKDLGDVNYGFHGSDYDVCIRHICLSCGLITDISTYALDDEELENELELYDLQNTPIYKELQKEREVIIA